MQHVDFQVHVMLGPEVWLRGSAMLPDECCSELLAFPFHNPSPSNKFEKNLLSECQPSTVLTLCTCVHLNLDISNSVSTTPHMCQGTDASASAMCQCLTAIRCQSTLHSHSHSGHSHSHSASPSPLYVRLPSLTSLCTPTP